jgi:hypothetical protein
MVDVVQNPSPDEEQAQQTLQLQKPTDPVLGLLKAQQDDSAQEIKAEQDSIDNGSWGSAVHGAYENSLIGSTLRQIGISSAVDEAEKKARQAGTFDPQWKPDYNLYADKSEEEMEELDKATTQEALDFILGEQSRRKKEQAALMSKGMGVAMGLSVLTSAPEALASGIVTGMGIGTLANAGRLGSMMNRSLAARNIASNVSAGLLTSTTQYAIDPYYTPQDIAIGSIADTVMSAPAVFKASGSKFRQHQLLKGSKSQAEPSEDLSASTEDLEFSRPLVNGQTLKTQDFTHSDDQLKAITDPPFTPDSTPINQYKQWSDLGYDTDKGLTAEALITGINKHRQTLIDIDDEFKAVKTEEITLPNTAVGKDAYDAIMEGAAFNDLGDIHLKQQSARDWITEHNAQGSLFKTDKDSPVIATQDIHTDFIDVADAVSKKYLGGQKVILVSGSPEGTRATVTNLEGGIVGITLDKNAHVPDLLHELGHVAARKALADVNIPNSMKADYVQGLKNIATAFKNRTSADSFDEVGSVTRKRFGSGTVQTKAVISEVSKDKYGIVEVGDPVTKNESILDTVVRTLSDMWNRWKGNKLGDENYAGSLDEIGAVSFQRYVSNELKLKRVAIKSDVRKVLVDTYRKTDITNLQVDKDINQYAFGTDTVHGALDDVDATEKAIFKSLEERSAQQMANRQARSVDELRSRDVQYQQSSGRKWVASAGDVNGYNRETTSPLAYVQETEAQKQSLEYEYGFRNSGTTRAEVEQNNTATAFVRKAFQAGVDNRLTPEQAYKSLLSPQVTPDVVNDKVAKHVLTTMGTHSGVNILDGIATQFASPSLIAAQSKNPAMRYAGKLLMEDPSGVAGKRVSNAGIQKDIALKNIVADFRRVDNKAYQQWLKDEGNFIKGLTSDETRKEFNRLVIAEVNNLKSGGVETGGYLTKAAKNILAINDRMRAIHKPLAEKAGVAAYMPSYDNPIPKILKRDALANIDQTMRDKIGVELRDKLTQAAEEQGFILDKTTARKWAEKLLNHGTDPSQGGNFRMFDASVHFNSSGIELEEFLDDVTIFGQPKEADLSKVAARRKQRMEVQLKALDAVNYDIPINNQGLKLSDLFETDYATAIMRQAESLAGLKAISSVGIPSWKHMDYVRYAIESGKTEYAATKTELRAFDQVVAELKGERPEFAKNIPTVDALGSLTSSSLLGGSTFAQMAESANIVTQFGFATAVRHFPEVTKMLREVKALARGQSIDGESTLAKFEQVSGTVVGMDGYFSRTLFDKLAGIGADRYTDVDRFNRVTGSLAHANIVFSGQRLVTAVQERMAAQIALSSLFDRIVGQPVSMRSMKSLEAAGATPEAISKWKEALQGKVSYRDGVYEFSSSDIPKEVIDEIQEVVVRHSAQTIQRGLIGETGAWQHDSLIRSALQFRGYGIVATEKQLVRQLETIGLGGWLGALSLGMVYAAPIYILRQHINAIGRSDREEYLNKMLAMNEMVPNLFNMVSNAGALFDLGATAKTVLIGSEFNRDTIGGAFFPSIQYANDSFSATRKLFNGDLSGFSKSALRLVPFANNPLIRASGNIARSLGEDK